MKTGDRIESRWSIYYIANVYVSLGNSMEGSGLILLGFQDNIDLVNRYRTKPIDKKCRYKCFVLFFLSYRFLKYYTIIANNTFMRL